MAHTIEEMYKAKAALCKEIASKIADFEYEYGFKVGNIEYYREVYAETEDGMPIFGEGECIIMLAL